MMKQKPEIPFYAKLAFVLTSIALILAFVYLAHGVLVPILMALLFAILLRPVVKFFNQRLKFPHVLASIVTVVLFVLVIAGIVFFVSWKIKSMASDLEQIKINLNIHYHHIQQWVKEQFNVSYSDQLKYIQQARKDSLPGTEVIGNTFSSFGDVFLNFTLVPIYVFLFLLYRNLFLTFLSKLFRPEYQHKLHQILDEVKAAVQSYLVGLLTEVLIVATLTSIGLSIVGVQYPILLGVITGVLNMIPYIGILIAAGLSMLATLTTSAELSVVFGVALVNAIVQPIDNNLVVPMVVSSKVKINAFVSLVSIIIGGLLAGIAGMFLAIPLVAIIKVIFDNIESLEPYGYLMGDERPKTYTWGKVTVAHLDSGNIVNGDPLKIENAKKTFFNRLKSMFGGKQK